ncbi:MAG TPA: hypothetical protein QF761_05055 [Pirellulales bacterium]|nr:hypothetical protein [Pirellulales bacterium]
MKCGTILAVGVVLLMAVDARAQMWGVGGGMGSDMGYHASTVAEGEGNAMSSVTRSKGQYQLDQSQARINRAQARTLEIQNRVDLAKSYFEARSINKQARFGDYAEKRKKNLARYGQEDLPTRLTSTELDPVTGQITWPIALEAPTFTPYTKPIDEAFVKRAETKARFSYDTYQNVTKDCKDINTELRSQVNTINAEDWTQAKSFVDRLRREIKAAAS